MEKGEPTHQTRGGLWGARCHKKGGGHRDKEMKQRVLVWGGYVSLGGLHRKIEKGGEERRKNKKNGNGKRDQKKYRCGDIAEGPLL